MLSILNENHNNIHAITFETLRSGSAIGGGSITPTSGGSLAGVAAGFSAGLGATLGSVTILSSSFSVAGSEAETK